MTAHSTWANELQTLSQLFRVLPVTLIAARRWELVPSEASGDWSAIRELNIEERKQR